MNRKQAHEMAEALVAQMTLEEAASQLRYDAPAIERLGIPAYNWWNEALHGVARAGTATSFPQAIGMAACFDPELIRRLGDVAATEGRAVYNAASAHGDRGIYKGLTFWSPNVNIFRDPRWGRGHETYGEDPFLTAETGTAYVRGLQGEGETMKAAACAKHFAAHSGPESKRHGFDAAVSKKDLEETYLPAFHALSDAGVEAIMGAYNRVNGQPSCASSVLMEELRGKWGFQGHFVSDCGAIQDFHEGHKITSRPEESVTLALKEGCDVNCGCTYQYIVKAWKEGLLKEEWVRRSAVRAFTTRYLLGTMQGSEFDRIPYTKIECPEHLAAAEQASRECCVLLKNDGLLPLKTDSIRTLGVIGPNANSRAALVGNYHGTSSRYVTVLEGLQDALGDSVRVLYAEGSHLFRDKVEACSPEDDDRISEAMTVAENSDVVVLVVGLDETLEGEEGDANNAYASGDKLDLLLPACQRRLAEAVLSVGKPTVLCLMAGSSIDLSAYADRVSAALLTWYPGARGGKAVADLLLGKASPSGKLPVTFYRNDQLDEMPAFEDYSMRGRTYRYVENAPLYPFGYGLTYGDVYVRSAKAQRTENNVSVTLEVCNASSISTQDVAQIYVQNEGSLNAPRNPRLCGFARVTCPAGESVNVTIEIPADRLKVVNEQGDFVDEGRVVLYAAMGQPDARTEALTGHAPVRMSL